MDALRLEELNASNVVAANSLTLKPGQEQFVAPVSNSIAEAYVNQSTAWPRVVYAGDELVGFIMANFDENSTREEFKALVLRMNVAAEAQGRGVGRFAIEQIAAEGRARGSEFLYAMWEPGEDGPDAFFRHLGFEVIGDNEFGETVGRLTLTS